LIVSESQAQFGAFHATGGVAVDLDDSDEPSWGSTMDLKVKPSMERLERFIRGIIKTDPVGRSRRETF
jgi:hypothetical protein